jgi:hypothetical protein
MLDKRINDHSLGHLWLLSTRSFETFSLKSRVSLGREETAASLL